MTPRRLVVLAACLLPGLALAHHHHFDHDFHATSSHHETAWECVHWEADVALSEADGGVSDGGVADAGPTEDGSACSCSLGSSAAVPPPTKPDGGMVLLVGVAGHAGEHCVEWAPAVGCSASGGLLPVAGLTLLALRRRARR